MFREFFNSLIIHNALFTIIFDKKIKKSLAFLKKMIRIANRIYWVKNKYLHDS